MRLLIDSTAGQDGVSAGRRAFAVTPTRVAKLTAAGLAPGESIPIYVRAGAPTNVTGSGCVGCSTEEADYLWTPLARCGAPVELTADNNQIIVSLPGNYSAGDPGVDPTFAGDVNVSMDELGAEFRSLPGECAPDAPTTLIETALAELGCVFNPDGSLLGKVVIQRVDDEDAGTTTYVQTLFQTDGTMVSPYTGAWTVCDVPPAERPVLVFLHQSVNTALSVADIMAATGAVRLHSITVKQVSGTGSITADSGTGVPVTTGETWSWSTVSGDNMDTLSTSALAMDAGTGEQRITATYTV